MRTYEARLDRLEASSSPKNGLLLLRVLDGETNAQALPRYARSRGRSPAEIHGPVIYLTEEEARLL